MDDILTRLTTLYPKAIEPGLARTLRLLHDLGDPHENLPPVIHIAGTNGKGSTLAFLRALLEDRGQICHVMTSPHLVKFNERMVIASREITDAALQALLERVERLNAGRPATFFEITTAAGFLAFAETRADYCLLETGMGGRLDSTNVVHRPALTVITTISLDHMQHLGDTLEKIAFEKAGILKKDTLCLLGQLPPVALAVFEDRAAAAGAQLVRYGHDWSYRETDTGFAVTLRDRTYDCPRPNLIGRHQIANAALAVASLLLLSLHPREGRGKDFSAIAHANWPARLQKIESGPLFDLLPETWELYLDGGHNEDGGRVLADQARHWADKPLHLILGMLGTKDPRPFYDHLAPCLASAIAVPIPDEKLAYPAPALAEILSIGDAPDPEKAIEEIVKAETPGRILIAGSLYLAGSVLRDYSD